MFFIYGINAIIPEKFTGTRLIGITAGDTCADAIRHIENYCDERSLLLSSVTIEPMGDEETIDAETVADAIALFANDWLPDWAEEERERYIGRWTVRIYRAGPEREKSFVRPSFN